VFLVENDTLDGLACRLPGFLEKGRDNAEQVLKCEASERKDVQEQQSCGNIVTAIVTWSILSLHVFVQDLNIQYEESLIVCNY
jgi:hypothetical protein